MIKKAFDKNNTLIIGENNFNESPETIEARTKGHNTFQERKRTVSWEYHTQHKYPSVISENQDILR